MNAADLDNYPNILPFGGTVKLLPEAFDLLECKLLASELLEQLNWKQEPIIMFGKKIMQPRLTAWYADNKKVYKYSGITMEANEWTPSLLKIKTRTETLSGITFNSALINLYRDGNDSMGWHRDNEKELGINPSIASVSLGAARKFDFRCYADKATKIKVLLPAGSLLLMTGETQQQWEHQLPKIKILHTSRINITFRVLI